MIETVNPEIKKYTDLLISRKYDPTVTPSQDQVIFTIQEKIIGTVQNFVILTGLPKAGKSTFLSALISSIFTPSDTFGMKLRFPEGRRQIAYFDTESSDYDFYRQVGRIRSFAGINGIPDWCSLYTVREDNPKEIRGMIETYLQTTNSPIVIIDGLLDLIFDYNNEVESRKLVNWFKRLTKQYQCLIIGVLHQGKGQAQTTLGHLGSNTDRWAQSTLEIIKDKEKNTFTMQSRFLRSSDDFNPVVLINAAGQWVQIDYESNTINKGSKKVSELEDKQLLNSCLFRPLQYKDLLNEVVEKTAKGSSAAKKIIKQWIEKQWIEKKENIYHIKN